MISEHLEAVRKVVVHDKCMDGLASAMLIREALPGAEITFCSYGAEHEALEPEPGLLFCDITPPRGKIEQFCGVGALVLDHHVTQRDLVALCGERGIYSDTPGVSGAVLAFEHVWVPVLRRFTDDGHLVTLQRQLFAELVGVRDTWRKDDPRWDEALELHAVLEAFPREHWLASNGIRNALEAVDTGIGAQLMARKAREIEQIVQHGLIKRFTRSPLGDQLWALSATRSELVSDLAEAARTIAGVDVLVNIQSIVRNGTLWSNVNLRSNDTCDVGAIAARHKGGGHKRASGFQVVQDASPLDLFSWLSTQSIL